MLADALVLFHGFDEFAAFKSIVGAGLFDVDVFSSLAAPNADERMPVIGSGDGDGVNLFVFEKFANVPISFGSGRAKFFDFGDALGGNIFVDVTERGDFHVGDMLESLDMIAAAAAQSANGDADAIIGAEDFSAERERCCACGDYSASCF